MSDEQEFDEDIASLEDSEQIHNQDDADAQEAAPAVPKQEISADAPLYRVRLAYSNETMLATWSDSELSAGTDVILPTRFGLDMATVIGRTSHSTGAALNDIAHIARVANEADLERALVDARKEKEAFVVCREKIAAHKLDMKLVCVHYLIDEPKILFFFTAETRVDFRELVKDLVAIFKTRIELRQIGVRDESRVVGGLGVCGRAYCCHAVSDKLKPVSIKMAKDQNLSLNSMKISGPCGRLLCCLAYEHGFYQDERRQMPPEGYRLTIEGENWKVIEVNPVAGRVKLSGEEGKLQDMDASRFERVEGRWRLIDSPHAENEAESGEDR